MRTFLSITAGVLDGKVLSLSLSISLSLVSCTALSPRLYRSLCRLYHQTGEISYIYIYIFFSVRTNCDYENKDRYLILMTWLRVL